MNSKPQTAQERFNIRRAQLIEQNNWNYESHVVSRSHFVTQIPIRHFHGPKRPHPMRYTIQAQLTPKQAWLNLTAALFGLVWTLYCYARSFIRKPL